MDRENKKTVSAYVVQTIFRLFIISILVTLVGAIESIAAEWYVSSTDGHDLNKGGTSWEDAFATIQQGINAASDDDLVLVADGIYTGDGNKNIELLGKAITLRSINGPENCIIDLQNDGRGFLLGWLDVAVIDGFTIMNGYHTLYGVAISCNYCANIIRNCIIKNNSGPQWGAGIDIRPSSAHPEIINTIFSGNHTTTGGSAISVFQGSATIINCTFVGNTGGSSVIGGNVNTTITNSIVWINRDRSNNLATIGGIVTYSDIEGGFEADGNIDTAFQSTSAQSCLISNSIKNLFVCVVTDQFISFKCSLLTRHNCVFGEISKLQIY